MKKQFVGSLIVLLASVIAFAEPKQVGDRLILDPVEAPGVIGIVHSENFEYACPVTVNDGKDAEGAPKTYESTVFIDTDFTEGTGYRFAMAFPENTKFFGMVAAEVKVVSVANGRCPGFCRSMELETADGEQKLRATTLENRISKEISLVVVDPASNEVHASGTCRLNEVE